LKPIIECSEEEKSKNNIVEKDGNIAIKFVKKENILKPISECSEKDLAKNNIVV
jgi:hypothetical protein